MSGDGARRDLPPREQAGGPAVLLGGWEHTRGCEPIDQLVMDVLGTRSPRVTIVPVASTTRMLPVAIHRARAYWRRFGAVAVEVSLPVTRYPQRGLENLDGADIIVLTGGLADGLGAVLRSTGAWDRMLGLWQRGAALVGSSRGLMEMFEWRWSLRTPRPFAIVPGLGLFGGYVSAPHFNRYAMRRWAPRMARALEPRGLGLLGLDERTALVDVPGSGFVVSGSGGVTVIDGTTSIRYESGEKVDLERLACDPRGAAQTPTP